MVCQQCNQTFLDLEQPPHGLCDKCVEAAGKCQKCDTSLAGKEVFKVEIEVDEVETKVNWCKDCYDEIYTDCAYCDETIEIWDAIEVDEKYYCHSCIDNHFVRCEDCNEYVRTRRTYSVYGNDYCSSCYHDNWYVCSNCDSYVRNGDYCDCEEEESKIHGHDYKPRVQFFGEKKQKLFFGFELEVENTSENDTSEQTAYDLCESLPEVYCKHDGSLDNGFEIVSHPLSFEYIAEKNLSPIFELADNGFKSFDTGTCGMHVHLSAEAFSALHLYKFMKFFYENQSFVFSVSQRKSNGELNEWAGFETDVSTIKRAKSKRNGCKGRYSAINLANSETVEVRIFKGSLKESTFRKNIEFCHAVYSFTHDAGIAEVTLDNFKAFASKNRKVYKNLIDFLTEKNLLTNEVK